MSFDAWFTLGVVVLVFAGLALTRISADLVVLGGLALLTVFGVLTPGQAVAGFGNEGLVTVGLLFVVAAGLRETGVSTVLLQRLLGQTRSVRTAQIKTMVPTTIFSAFLNNTPVVAIMLPVVHDWARRNGLSVSKLLMPLSFASILGGMCTLIGTSTNLVVHGLMLDQGLSGLGMFDLTWVGLPIAVVGVGYMWLFADRLLPDRKPAAGQLADAREYTLEMVVTRGGPLDGRSIEEAGLRRLPGAYLVEINRDGHVLPAVGPGERLRSGDQLVFVGVVESMVDLQRFPGLQPATTQVFKLDVPRPERVLVEAVVSNTCPLVGKTIREGRFRTYYDAVVLAVSRNGERIRAKIGDIVLEPGDTLLLEALPSFVEHRRNSRDFFLVSRLDGAVVHRYDRRWAAIAIFVAMVALAASGLFSMLEAAFLAAAAMLLTKACSEDVARRAIDWQLLLLIGAALGVGRALEVSGAAPAIAAALIGLAQNDPVLTLAVVYLVTMLFTEVVTNNAAAVLVFPIAHAAAGALGVNAMPFYVAVAIAASAAFMTPIGYQTNLMVFGPGGYRFSDFARLGLALNAIGLTLTVLLAPRVWPF